MKTKCFSILTVMCLTTLFFLTNTSAQASPQWHLPDGVRTRLGKGTIGGIAYSPDGSRLAVGGSIGIWVYDARRGSEVALIGAYTSSTSNVAYSPDGNTIATGSNDGTVQLWDANTGTLRNTLRHTDGVSNIIAYSPDGNTIATGGADNTVHLWNANTGTLRNTLIGHTFFVTSVTYSPDGNTLATGSGDGTVRLWNINTGTLRNTLEHTGLVESVAYSPDGNTLATGCWDNIVRLWDTNTGTLRNTLRHTNAVSSVAYSPDGNTIATGGYDHTVRLWDANTNTLRNTLRHTYEVWSVTYSPDGNTIATGSYDHIVRLWDAHTGTLRNTLEHTGWVNSVVYSPDGNTIATGSGDNTVHLWDAHTGTLQNTLTGHTHHVESVAYSPDGNTIASGSRDNTVHLWDAHTGTLRNTLTGHTHHVESVAYSPDGNTIATGSGDRTVRLWDAHTGILRNTLKHTDWVNSVVYSPDGNTIATALRDRVHLWDVATSTLRNTLTGHTFGIESLAFSPVGRTLASGSSDGTVLLWRIIPTTAPLTFNPSTVADQTFEVGTPVNVTLPIAIGGTSPYTYTLSAVPAGLAFAPATRVLFGTPTTPRNPTPVTYTVTDAAGQTASLTFTIAVTAAQVVDIPDANFRAAIAQALNKAPGDAITRAEMETLVELSAFGRDITDLRGIEFAINLTRLDLWRNSISDISPLASLTNLTQLYLWENTISDISPLAGLTNLTSLSLSGNTISNIVPLIALTNLTHLYVHSNNISDIETIERLMAQGTVVYFSGNPAFETPGPKIEDGWVWLVVPATDVHNGSDAARSDRDFLSEASGGSVTEADVARNGASAGTQVGGSVWTYATLNAADPDNLNAIVSGYNLGTDIPYPVAYGVVSLQSETQQQTRMYIGGAPVKIWLNGTLVYKDTDDRGWAGQYETAVPVVLMPGENLLFVAAYRAYPGNRWGAFFGFQDGTVYAGPGDLDVNGDGKVDVLDLVWVAVSYGMRGAGLPADVNSDGVVNVQDLVAVAAGVDAAAALPLKVVEAVLLAAEGAAAEMDGIAAAPMGFGTRPHALSSGIAYRNVAAALADVRHLAVDAHLIEGVELLESLLSYLREIATIPETTALLPNYPNPFNPETWIPYQLSEPAEVTLTIYTVNGTKVRTLALGQMPAGIYQSRARAAYWDGKNDVGEPVASAVYFYTLTAGDFTATRKLLIRK